MRMTAHASSADDPALQELCGIRRLHAQRLLTFCQGGYRARQLIVIVRAANPASARFQGLPGHAPKPYGVNEKTRRSGRVRVTPGGPFYYSDYDLQGVFEQRATRDYARLYVGNYVPGSIGTSDAVDPRANPFLDALNQYVCRAFGDDDMFQHGTQDDYRAGGRPVKPLKDDAFAAFEHTGRVALLPDLQALRGYYQAHAGMTWIY